MAEFPTDVVTDILSRLPVKPLLRFRCVSKPWCALIDSPRFVKLHLKRSIEGKSNHSLILRDCTIHSVSLDTLDIAVELDDHPLNYDDGSGTEVSGSCHGLVLLYNSLEDVCLWNPFTKKHQKLPVSEIEFPDYFTFCDYTTYGLGYDSFGDDYKVLRVIQFNGDGTFDSEVKVYSLKSNSWKRIKDFPYRLLHKRCHGVFANGALHWVVVAHKKEQADPGCFVAAFDLGTEEYRSVPTPDFGDKKFHMNVEVLGGCLCLLCNYVDRHVDVWVMKDYRVKESWTKLFSVAQPKHISSFQFVVPLAYSKNGNQVLLLQDNSKLVWFDLDRKEVKKISVRGLPKDYFEAELCVQSLVPLSGGGSVIKKQRKQTQEKMQNKTGKKRDGFLSKGFKLKL